MTVTSSLCVRKVLGVRLWGWVRRWKPLLGISAEGTLELGSLRTCSPGSRPVLLGCSSLRCQCHKPSPSWRQVNYGTCRASLCQYSPKFPSSHCRDPLPLGLGEASFSWLRFILWSGGAQCKDQSVEGLDCLAGLMGLFPGGVAGESHKECRRTAGFLALEMLLLCFAWWDNSRHGLIYGAKTGLPAVWHYSWHR